MLRAWCRLLLILVIGVYGLQAAPAGHHVHALDERSSCAACVLHDTPGLRTPIAVAPAPPPLEAPDLGPRRPVDPPRALTPRDVSPSTSPPAAIRAA